MFIGRVVLNDPQLLWERNVIPLLKELSIKWRRCSINVSRLTTL